MGRRQGADGSPRPGVGAEPATESPGSVEQLQPTSWSADQFVNERSKARHGRLYVGIDLAGAKAKAALCRLVKMFGEGSRCLGEPDSTEFREPDAEVDLVVIDHLAVLSHARHHYRKKAAGPGVSDRSWTAVADHHISAVKARSELSGIHEAR